MSRAFYAWAPYPLRPLVDIALVREFQYVYGAVSPTDGTSVFMRVEKMNTANMQIHLDLISKKYPSDLVMIVMDNASSHTAKALQVPSNISICPLPPYSPELNPQEQVWKKMRTFSANMIFSTMEKCIAHIDQSIEKLLHSPLELSRLTNWDWIKVAS